MLQLFIVERFININGNRARNAAVAIIICVLEIKTTQPLHKFIPCVKSAGNLSQGNQSPFSLQLC